MQCTVCWYLVRNELEGIILFDSRPVLLLRIYRSANIAIYLPEQPTLAFGLRD
jgi:hypothetical protein